MTKLTQYTSGLNFFQSNFNKFLLTLIAGVRVNLTYVNASKNFYLKMCYIIQIYPTVGSLGQRLTQYTSGLNFLQLDFKKFPTHFDYREISQLDLCKCKSIFFNLKMCCIIQIYPTVGGLGQRF